MIALPGDRIVITLPVLVLKNDSKGVSIYLHFSWRTLLYSVIFGYYEVCKT